MPVPVILELERLRRPATICAFVGRNILLR